MLKKLFGFDPAKTTVKTEIIAGITTFLTMSYILAVNPSMFSDLSMPGGAVFTSTALAAYLFHLKRYPHRNDHICDPEHDLRQLQEDHSRDVYPHSPVHP